VPSFFLDFLSSLSIVISAIAVMCDLTSSMDSVVDAAIRRQVRAVHLSKVLKSECQDPADDLNLVRSIHLDWLIGLAFMRVSALEEPGQYILLDELERVVWHVCIRRCRFGLDVRQSSLKDLAVAMRLWLGTAILWLWRHRLLGNMVVLTVG
jgi:hypothetical protein